MGDILLKCRGEDGREREDQRKVKRRGRGGHGRENMEGDSGTSFVDFELYASVSVTTIYVRVCVVVISSVCQL